MPMQKSLYPPDWPEIAEQLKASAKWTCAECGAKRGETRPNRHGVAVPVQIQVAHLDHDPWNRQARLRVLCRQCHIKYDAGDARRKRAMMRIARGQLVLPGWFEWYSASPVQEQNTPLMASIQNLLRRALPGWMKRRR